MAKKKFRLVVNSPAGIIFAGLSLFIFILNVTAFKGALVQGGFTACGNGSSSMPFTGKSFLDFFRLFSHVLGNSNWWTMFLNLAMILMLAPKFEERFGPLIIVFIGVLGSHLSGVLCACISGSPRNGAQCLVFLMMFLGLFENLSKKEIHLSWILGVVSYFAFILISGFENLSGYQGFWGDFWKANSGNIGDLFGGAVGSIFGLLIAPKKRKVQKEKSEDSVFAEDDSEKPEKKEKKSVFGWGKKKASKKPDGNEEIIGTFEL